MKRVWTLCLSLILMAALLAGCGGTDQTAGSGKTPEELTQAYTDAITQNGGEMVEYNPVVTEVREDDGSAMILEVLGLKQEDMTAFAASVSLMNVKAYGIAAVMPAEGKAETVTAGLQSFIDLQKSSFEQYLPDQFEVAKNARLETLADGTVLMVMCEDQDAVFEGICTALEG